MSTENAIKFLAQVTENASLQERLKVIKNPDELIALAKEQGYEVSADDFKAANQIALSEDELSEDELEAVAGGASVPPPTYFRKKIYKSITSIFGF